MHKSLLAFLLAICVGSASAQTGFWSNAGALVSIRDTSFISVIGDMYNSNQGIYYNFDSIFLTGDWSNTAGNHAFDSILVPSNTGYIYMYAADQRIKGTAQTYFHNLILKNQGTKFADIDAKVDGFLDMTDREFSVDTNTIWVRNPRLNSVRRTTGFLSSLKDGGLLRYTDADSTYLYPVGSNLGTSRYRPIEVTPTSAQHNQFKVRFANVDPTSEGFNRNIRFHLVCSINPNWYHRIYHPLGTDSADLAFFYDPTADGQWNDVAHWQHIPEWEAMFRDTIIAGMPFTKMAKYHWNDYSYSPFALAIVSPPFANAGPNDSICSGASVVLGYPAPDSSYFYHWTPPTGLSDTSISDPTFSMTNLGTTNVLYPFTLEVDHIGCTDTSRTSVLVYPKPRPDAGPDVSICSGASVTLGTDPQEGYTYSWSPPIGLSDPSISDPVFSTTNPGTSSDVYNLTLNVVQNGCKDSDKVVVTVFPQTRAIAGVDTILWDKDSIHLVSYGGISYRWSPDYNISDLNSEFPVVYPEHSTIYYVTVTDLNNCSGFDSVYVLVREKPFVNFFIPDVITPNGDGINDFWHIRDLERYPDNQVRIVNRWGDEILFEKPYQQDWKGTWHGEPLPGATYYYVIKVKNDQGIEAEFDGPITVVR